MMLAVIVTACATFRLAFSEPKTEIVYILGNDTGARGGTIHCRCSRLDGTRHMPPDERVFVLGRGYQRRRRSQ